MNKSWSSDEIRQLKELNPIVQVAAELGIEVVRGRARCIFPHNHSHGDRTPSMSIQADAGTFKCWVCDQVSGDVIQLVRLVKGCSFSEALSWLGGRVSIERSHTHVHKSSEAAVKRKAHFDMDLEYRSAMILDFLKLCKPVNGAVLNYLVSRKIFKNTADLLKVRMIDDYDVVSKKLKELYPMSDLQAYGFYSETDHLRFYKHPLIFPYINHQGLPVYFQARAIEPGVQPKELNIKGPIPLPYNAPLLNQKAGVLFLCEGVIDTLSFLTKNFQAVGVPGVNSFKKEWFDLFTHKKVFIAFDLDEAGRKAAHALHVSFAERGIHSSIITYPKGEDANEWFTS